MTATTDDPDAPVQVHHPTGPMPYLDLVDPRDIIADDNSRDDQPISERDPALLASVMQHGVRTAVTANPEPDGRLRLRWGFGRLEAAVLARHKHPLIMVVVADAADDTPEQRLIDQISENAVRTSYSTVELARNYERLALFGLSPDDIATQISAPVDRVRAGIAVAHSEHARTAAHAHPQLDMFQLATLAEFDDDDAARQQLLDVLEGEPDEFDHEVAELRRDRATQQLVRDVETGLWERGFTLVDPDLPATTLPLARLYAHHEDDTVLTGETHTECPGRGAFIQTNFRGDITVTQVCVDFATHSHRDIHAEANERAVQQLRAEGVEVLDPGGLPDTARRLDNLHARPGDTRVLSRDTHADCPGHAAHVVVNSAGSASTTWVCRDYPRHGHELVAWLRTTTRTTGGKLTEREKAERNRVGANNKKWLAALDARRTWLTTTLFADWQTRKTTKLPARVHQYLAEALCQGDGHLTNAMGRRNILACTLLGFKEPSYGKPHPIVTKLKPANANQAVMLTLAIVIGGLEAHYDTHAAHNTWRSPTAEDRLYLRMLQHWGYKLGVVERLVLDPRADADKWPHLAVPTPSSLAAAAPAEPCPAEDATENAEHDPDADVEVDVEPDETDETDEGDWDDTA